MNRGASDPALKRAIDVQMSGVGNQSKYSKHTGLTKDDSQPVIKKNVGSGNTPKFNSQGHVMMFDEKNSDSDRQYRWTPG